MALLGSNRLLYDNSLLVAYIPAPIGKRIHSNDQQVDNTTLVLAHTPSTIAARKAYRCIYWYWFRSANSRLVPRPRGNEATITASEVSYLPWWLLVSLRLHVVSNAYIFITNDHTCACSYWLIQVLLFSPLWNHLPAEIVNANSVNLFRTALYTRIHPWIT